MAVEEFFKGYLETVLQPDELLTEIQVPIPPPHTGTAYKKFGLREADMGLIVTAVSITLSSKNGTCSAARIALGAVSSVAMRAKRAAEVLVGKEIDDTVLEEAAQVASEEADPISDIQASEEYKRELVKIFVKRVGREALERARTA